MGECLESKTAKRVVGNGEENPLSCLVLVNASEARNGCVSVLRDGLWGLREALRSNLYILEMTEFCVIIFGDAAHVSISFTPA